MHVTMTVNGEEVERDIEPRVLLVHFLRDDLGLTGTHWGCDTSNCGACVVQIDGEPVKSCTTLAVMADGCHVRTVEGLAENGSLDPVQREELHARIERTVRGLAAAAGAEVEVEIEAKEGYPVLVNDPELVRVMLPTLRRVAPRLVEAPPRLGADDFAFFAERVPGFYFWLGVRPAKLAEADAAPNHSPRFFLDEGALPLGVRALAWLAADYLALPRDARPVR